MSSLLITNISRLAGVREGIPSRLSGAALAELPSVTDAYLLIEDGLFGAWGPIAEAPTAGVERTIDAKGGIVLPSFCDSHTHLVYAGSREIEYVDKIRGLSYEEIAKRGGGILNSAARLHKATEEQLYEEALPRLESMLAGGTGAVEIKSGYGLNTEDELKMLRVVRRLREGAPCEIRATFLGAHAVPAEYKGRQGEYVDLIINEMIPLVAGEGLAEFIDVFCDRGFFTVEETERMLMQGIKYGLTPKIHANELACSGGIQVGVKYGARSVDHLEHTGTPEMDALRGSETMATLLPGAAFFLGMSYPPAREMIDSGVAVALASDYNPGSSPSGSMKFILSLASIKLRMTPEEAINAATVNGAYAMGLEETMGSIRIGAVANCVVTRPMPSLEYIPYAYTEPLGGTAILRGYPL